MQQLIIGLDATGLINEMEVSGPAEIDFGIEEIDDEDDDAEDEGDEDEDEDGSENDDYYQVIVLLDFSSALSDHEVNIHHHIFLDYYRIGSRSSKMRMMAATLMRIQETGQL